ncbi:hypothetical protein D9M68_886420 [compost metagenome]
MQSGVMARNAVITAQLNAGADSFSVPFWRDLGDEEANISSDDPTVFSTPNLIQASKQLVRKAFLHQSWSAMNLASELAGSDAMISVMSPVRIMLLRSSCQSDLAFPCAYSVAISSFANAISRGRLCLETVI